MQGAPGSCISFLYLPLSPLNLSFPNLNTCAPSSPSSLISDLWIDFLLFTLSYSSSHWLVFGVSHTRIPPLCMLPRRHLYMQGVCPYSYVYHFYACTHEFITLAYMHTYIHPHPLAAAPLGYPLDLSVCPDLPVGGVRPDLHHREFFFKFHLFLVSKVY